jgi:cation diffusion facilitator CzcD-associated flavoprotein CzcO
VSPLDWLIVGGGVHGTYLSHALIGRGGVPRDRLRVLDPEEAPLAAFWRMTSATGMKYMRSPGVHHLGLHPYDLRRFARKAASRGIPRFSPPYERPSLPLFRAHTDAVIGQQRLDQLRLRGRASALHRHGAGFRVETEQGSLEARRVVLALGVSEQPHFPPWAFPHPRLQHLFAPDFSRETLSSGPVVIVGGGISAAQLACALAPHHEVRMVVRHEPRVHRFDSDPGWLGPRSLDAFRRTSDLGARRRTILEARHRGSMPPEIAAELRLSLRSGRIQWIQDEIHQVEPTSDGLRLLLRKHPSPLDAAHVVLATGFEPRRPGAFLDDAIPRLGLPCAPCGFPRLPPSLAWAPGLLVSGSLAELELGPTARNIAGARSAAERILAAA